MTQDHSNIPLPYRPDPRTRVHSGPDLHVPDFLRRAPAPTRAVSIEEIRVEGYFAGYRSLPAEHVPVPLFFPTPDWVGSTLGQLATRNSPEISPAYLANYVAAHIAIMAYAQNISRGSQELASIVVGSGTPPTVVLLSTIMRLTRPTEKWLCGMIENFRITRPNGTGDVAISVADAIRTVNTAPNPIE